MPTKPAPTALFVSPHLDDAAFSCGGLLARLSNEGWRTVLATAFTASVPDPTGFALECQLDKGLPPEADYMALRREEDGRFAARAGVTDLVWLGHPEAPHRGYGSAGELFAGVRDDDLVWKPLADDLSRLSVEVGPDLVLLPQGLGGHADHLQTIRAALRCLPPEIIAFYRDAPYAMRDPHARPAPLLPRPTRERPVDVTGTLETKLRACASYATQLGFQFGGEGQMRRLLGDFARAEAARTGHDGRATETVLAASAPALEALSRL